MKQPSEAAGHAAESLRSLVYATMRRQPGNGWEFPSDAYDVIGELQLVAMRMPQVLQQTGLFVDDIADEGRLGVDAGGTDVAGSQVDLGDALRAAMAAAEELTKALALAHSVASHLTYRLD